jgi:hypothetical protein
MCDKQLHLHHVAVTGPHWSEVQAAITTGIMTICTGDTGAGVTVLAIITTTTTATRTENARALP